MANRQRESGVQLLESDIKITNKELEVLGQVTRGLGNEKLRAGRIGTISENATVPQSLAGKQIPEPVAFNGDGTDVKLKLPGIKTCLWDPGFAHEAAATVNPKANQRDGAVS